MSSGEAAGDRPRYETIAQRYARIGGFTHGFDYMRIALALGVLLQHSALSSYGPPAGAWLWGGWTRIIVAPILPMFFGLSGFLVAGSLKKNPTVTSFLTLRAVRIVPALAVEVLLSALLLGPAFTELSLDDYFGAKKFWTYFQNIAGRIHFELPGVFTHLPVPNMVNISLWTVPYELECYGALMVVYLIGLTRRRGLFLLFTLATVAIGTATAFSSYDDFWAHNAPLPRSLIVAFLAGVGFNLYADRVVLSRWIALLMLALLVATTTSYQTIYLAAIPAVYLVIYLGMMHPPKRTWLFSGDYSYGLYLFAFPIQQTYTALFPGARHAALNAGFTIVFGLLYACFSWWCIEKPLLSRKGWVVRRVEALRDVVLRRFHGRPRGHVHAVGPRIG